MPEPIQSQAPNQSYYDPSEQLSRAPAPALPVAAPVGESLAGSVMVPDGKEVLLKKYGSGGEDCAKHLVTAGTSFVAAGASAAGGLATAASVVGPVVGMAGSAAGIVNGFAELANYFNCEDQNERLREAAVECSAQGGALFGGAGDSEAICVLSRE